jgi:hypothetical protein
VASVAFFTKIAGVSHCNDDGTSRQDVVRRCREGEVLRLGREPNKPHDPNAVRVLRQNGEQLGYLPAHVAATGLACDLDEGRNFHVIVDAITGRDKEMLGVNLKITEVDDPAQALPPATQSTGWVAPLLWFAAIVLLVVTVPVAR